MLLTKIDFPEYTGARCLMMPFIQGDISSVPKPYHSYAEIIESVFFKKGDIGFLTIDESSVKAGTPQRGDRAKYGRALHTEAGILPNKIYAWGGGGWGKNHNVELERDVKVLLANNIDHSCAIWDAWQDETSDDGDIGYLSEKYPYSEAIMLKSGEVHEIGILTPHESLPLKDDAKRQFIRIISSGVHGREPYFTINPLIN